jgi:hypothetical protein
MVVESEGLFWTLAFTLFLTAVVVMVIAGVFGHAAVVRGQRRGYRPPGLLAGVLLVVLALAGAAFVPVALEIDLFLPSPSTDLGPIVLVVLVSVGALVGSVLAWRLATIVPLRAARYPGLRPRRHRYQVWSAVAIPLTTGAVIWAWTSADISTTIKVLMVGIGLALALRRLERRFRSQLPSVPDQLSGHVLYLRPFSIEGRATFRLPDRSAEFMGNGLRNFVTLDEFLVRGAGDQLGPVIALGNPAEFVPQGGATRIYLSDNDWQDQLARLAGTAKQIVMQPGRTQSMRWELRCIAALGLQRKLFVLTPPQRRYSVLWRRFIPTIDRLYGWDPPTWLEFVHELRSLGFTVTCPDPGPGAVINFDDHRAAVIIAQRLKNPEEFADAMLRQTGRPLNP